MVQTYHRCPSHEAVPAHGAWPLGLGEEKGKPRETTVDTYEVAKQQELERRLQDLPRRLRKVATAAGLETRQFDYRPSGEKNPLFGPLDERLRKQALLQALESASPSDEEAMLPNLSSSPRTGGAAYLHKCQALEEQETQRSLELDDLRASRKRIGCSCHQSKAPDKLSLKKLKEELHRRHQSAPGTDKGKLAEQLKEVMRDEKLCSDGAPDECECFVAGVPCHADVCGCCAGKKGTGGGGGKGHHDCQNPLGNFLYQEASVRGHRFRYLTAVPKEGGRARSSSI